MSRAKTKPSKDATEALTQEKLAKISTSIRRTKFRKGEPIVILVDGNPYLEYKDGERKPCKI